MVEGIPVVVEAAIHISNHFLALSSEGMWVEGERLAYLGDTLRVACCPLTCSEMRIFLCEAEVFSEPFVILLDVSRLKLNLSAGKCHLYSPYHRTL